MGFEDPEENAEGMGAMPLSTVKSPTAGLLPKPDSRPVCIYCELPLAYVSLSKTHNFLKYGLHDRGSPIPVCSSWALLPK